MEYLTTIYIGMMLCTTWIMLALSDDPGKEIGIIMLGVLFWPMTLVIAMAFGGEYTTDKDDNP